jgi:hypothetical protein
MGKTVNKCCTTGDQKNERPQDSLSKQPTKKVRSIQSGVDKLGLGDDTMKSTTTFNESLAGETSQGDIMS